MQSIENILFHELIGLKIKICQSPQLNLVNLTGLIVFETKNLLMIKTLKGIKKIAKNIILKCVIYVHFNNSCFLSGNQLMGRPEDRILKIRR